MKIDWRNKFEAVRVDVRPFSKWTTLGRLSTSTYLWTTSIKYIQGKLNYQSDHLSQPCISGSSSSIIRERRGINVNPNLAVLHSWKGDGRLCSKTGTHILNERPPYKILVMSISLPCNRQLSVVPVPLAAGTALFSLHSLISTLK